MRTVPVMALAVMLSGFAVAAHATPQLDSNGKCREGGKFVAATRCKPAAPKTAARCRNDKGKFVSCSAPGAKPVK